MSGPDSQSIFPLPLMPLEYYYWCDNRSDYPTTYPVDLHFSGRLDRSRLTEALAMTLRRHPMLTARIRVDERGQPQWVAGDDQPPTIDWAPAGTPITHPDGPMIDLTRAPGLRVWVREGADCTRLALQFHHACCDGQASLRVSEELLGAYDYVCGGGRHPDQLWPLDPDRIRRRGDYGPPPKGLWPLMQTYALGAWFWSRLMWRTPKPVAAPTKLEGTPQDYLGYARRRIEPELVGQLRAAAGVMGCTLNHLLLRDTFFAVRDWNVRHGERWDGWLRINVPTSLRDRDDKATPAANRLGFAFLTRNGRQCHDPDRLLRSVQREMEEIRRYRLGLYFLGGLDIGRKLNMIRPMLNAPRSFATVVLSYVGQVFTRSPLARADGRLTCGGAVLEAVAGVPPIRPLTRAAIAVTRYAGGTWLNLRCDPQYFSQEQTVELLDLYLAQLKRSAASPPERR
jgi:hypothetical protein